MGYSAWARKESDMTEHTHTQDFCAFFCVYINANVYFLNGNFPPVFADAVIHMYIFEGLYFIFS